MEGFYRSDELEPIYRVTTAGGKLLVNFGHTSVTLLPKGKDTFGNEWMTIETTPKGFILQTERAKNLKFMKLGAKKLAY